MFLGIIDHAKDSELRLNTGGMEDFKEGIT